MGLGFEPQRDHKNVTGKAKQRRTFTAVKSSSAVIWAATPEGAGRELRMTMWNTAAAATSMRRVPKKTIDYPCTNENRKPSASAIRRNVES